MISVSCGSCGRGMTPIEGTCEENGYCEETYECKTCNILLEVKSQKKIPDWREIVKKASSYKSSDDTPWEDDDDKDVCEGLKDREGDNTDDIIFAEKGVCLTEDYPQEKCCKESDDEPDDYKDLEEKCCAEAPLETISDLELKVRRLKLEKEILNLEEDVSYARERERRRE